MNNLEFDVARFPMDVTIKQLLKYIKKGMIIVDRDEVVGVANNPWLQIEKQDYIKYSPIVGFGVITLVGIARNEWAVADGIQRIRCFQELKSGKLCVQSERDYEDIKTEFIRCDIIKSINDDVDTKKLIDLVNCRLNCNKIYLPEMRKGGIDGQEMGI